MLSAVTFILLQGKVAVVTVLWTVHSIPDTVGVILPNAALSRRACKIALQGAGNCAGSERSMEDSVGDVLLWQMATTASPVVTGVLPAQGRCVC